MSKAITPTKTDRPKFKTQYNAVYFPDKFEKGGGVSQTAPNQTMSVSQILSRFTGQPYPYAGSPQYHGEEEVMSLDEYKRLDLSEQQDLIQAARERTHGVLARLRRKQQLADIEDQKTIFRTEFEQEFKAKQLRDGKQMPGQDQDG